MTFPKRIQLSEEILHARKLRTSSMVRIAAIGILVRFIIAAVELAGSVVFESSALLLDALATFADVGSSLLLIISIKLAERPPDREHPFGHGRYEPLVGLQLGIFIIIAGVGMFVHEVVQFSQIEIQAPIDARAWFLPLCACILLEFSFKKMCRVAAKENSSALKSEAFHFRIDSLNSLLALVALLLAALIPEWSVFCDRLGAIGIALFMLGVGLYSAKINLDQVLDRIPPPEYFQKVKMAALSVEGILETEKILIQVYGPDAHVAIDVEVDPKLSVDKAHTLSQYVRTSIQKAWPQVRDVVVHVEPYYPDDHKDPYELR